jgi:hypothetical protein
MPAGPEPDEEPPARDLLERGRHLREQPGMAVRHVQHERPEGDPPRDFGERGQHGHGLGHARARVRLGLGIPKVIPRPHAVEAGLLDGERRGAQVRPAGAHRDEEDIGLQPDACA